MSTFDHNDTFFQEIQEVLDFILLEFVAESVPLPASSVYHSDSPMSPIITTDKVIKNDHINYNLKERSTICDQSFASTGDFYDETQIDIETVDYQARISEEMQSSMETPPITPEESFSINTDKQKTPIDMECFKIDPQQEISISSSLKINIKPEEDPKNFPFEKNKVGISTILRIEVVRDKVNSNIVQLTIIWSPTWVKKANCLCDELIKDYWERVTHHCANEFNIMEPHEEDDVVRVLSHVYFTEPRSKSDPTLIYLLQWKPNIINTPEDFQNFLVNYGGAFTVYLKKNPSVMSDHEIKLFRGLTMSNKTKMKKRLTMSKMKKTRSSRSSSNDPYLTLEELNMVFSGDNFVRF